MFSSGHSYRHGRDLQNVNSPLFHTTIAKQQTLPATTSSASSNNTVTSIIEKISQACLQTPRTQGAGKVFYRAPPLVWSVAYLKLQHN